MSDSLHDTIDIKDEVDEVDAIMATATSARAATAHGERVDLVELALVTVANSIWAVVGLLLWLPQAVRAVLAAALRMVHAALTQQSSGRAVSSIRRVSRSYVERFLRRGGDAGGIGRRQELRPFRLLGETAWTAAFYLLILRWLAPERFSPLWQRLRSAGTSAQAWAGRAADSLKSWLVLDLAEIDAGRAQAAGVLLAAALVGVLLGIWLGRRGR